jgi:hypothetical protein
LKKLPHPTHYYLLSGELETLRRVIQDKGFVFNMGLSGLTKTQMRSQNMAL